MREIKFRAWSKEHKDFVYDVQCEYDSIAGLVFEKSGQEPYKATFNSYLTDDNYIVEQYTGLKDKTGKEIYEGDFVKIFNNHIGNIIYENGSFIVGLGLGLINQSLRSLMPYDVLRCEKIGDIHNNPEYSEQK